MNTAYLNISLWHCKSRLLCLGHARLGTIKVTLYLSEIIILTLNSFNWNVGYGLKELRAFISNLYFQLLAFRPPSHGGGRGKLWAYEHMDKVLSSLVTPQLTLLQAGGWARDLVRCLPAWIIQCFCNSIISNKVQKQYSNESWNLSVIFFQHVLLIYLKT